MRLVQKKFHVTDYDLAATLACGQAFRWRFDHGAWEGVIDSHWVRLHQNVKSTLTATYWASDTSDWTELIRYLQLEIDLDSVLSTFPNDEPMRLAMAHGRGLRLLRQAPWECLASFILSSTKQIVQIQQIVERLCERFGQPLPTPPGHAPVYAFPSAERLATCSETDLRNCKMGFRAPYLLATARKIASGELALPDLSNLAMAEAREKLIALPGVGRKIADCVLLFAYGFPQAFPIDVWVLKALRQLYFPKRKPTQKRLFHFSESYFGPNSGYAQQYLFHYMRKGRG